MCFVSSRGSLQNRRKTVCRFFVCTGIVLGAMLAGACTSIIDSVPDRTPDMREAESPVREAVSDGLEKTAFLNLPPETYAYLQSIAAAFQRHDGQFLLDQGEASFQEWAAANLPDESAVLARLFRIGPYAEDAPSMVMRIPHLAAADVRGITYLDWEEWGPLLEVHAQLITDRATFPARLLVIWRLENPKIQGFAGD
jgi:hypothetical protein